MKILNLLVQVVIRICLIMFLSAVCIGGVKLILISLEKEHDPLSYPVFFGAGAVLYVLYDLISNYIFKSKK